MAGTNTDNAIIFSKSNKIDSKFKCWGLATAGNTNGRMNGNDRRISNLVVLRVDVDDHDGVEGMKLIIATATIKTRSLIFACILFLALAFRLYSNCDIIIT